MDWKGTPKMDKQLIIYFAGPDVFRQNPQKYFDNVAEQCVKYNIIPSFPFDSLLVKSDSIYLRNLHLIDKCHLLIANISPFRGPSTDPGTALEIGYAKALGKPVIAYSEPNMVTYKTRVTDDLIEQFSEYPYVENFGLTDNLMIVHSCDFIHDSLQKALYNARTFYKWILDDDGE